MTFKLARWFQPERYANRPEDDFIREEILGDLYEAEAVGITAGGSHAYEQGSSYYPEPTDTPHGRAARTLRITEEELPEGIPDKEAFAAFVETLRPRWAEEAAEGKRLLGITDTSEKCYACTGTGFESTDPEDASPCLRCNGTGNEPRS